MSFERGMLGLLVLLSVAIVLLSGFDRGVMAVLAGFLIGGGLWALLVQRVPYRWMYWAYFGGVAIPIGLAIVAPILMGTP